VSARYAFIFAEKAFPTRRGCMLLEVSTSGYYAWRQRPASPTRIRRGIVAAKAAQAHEASDGVSGYRKVHRDLLEGGVVASCALVRRVMHEGRLFGVSARRFRTTTIQDPSAVAAPDLLGRDFTSSVPGTKLVADITYLRCWNGWAYLAVVIDIATRRVVGWQISDRPDAALCSGALEMACRNGHVALDAIFHSDRGTQYTAKAFTATCERIGVRRSMGRTGVCWDNAMAETFFASLKVESIYRVAIPTIEHAKRVVGRYIEVFYNRRRRHGSLDYQTPEQRYLQLTNRAHSA